MKVVKLLFYIFKKYEFWLDVGVIFIWGFLLINYWLIGKLYILIYFCYFGLIIVVGIGLLILGGWKLL